MPLNFKEEDFLIIREYLLYFNAISGNNPLPFKELENLVEKDEKRRKTS